MRENIITRALVSAALVLAVVLALWAQSPPSPASEDAPATTFSAARAMAHVRAVAHAPHSIGSAEHAAVRSYLLRTLAEGGISAEVQEVETLEPGYQNALVGAKVRNVVARIPGTEGAHAVLVVAHYDSAPRSPGASDNGAGVAALLELGRLLRARGPHKNDVVLLFSDGEEVGLLGAGAFLRLHPVVERVRAVINVEARGTSGPAIMFETGSANGSLVRRFAASRRPVGNSLAVEAYRHMPNDTDFTRFRQAGLPGLNFAFIEGADRYHTSQDDVLHLSPSSLQHEGDCLDAVVGSLADADLDQVTGGDAVFFDVFATFVHYPAAAALPLAGVMVLLVIVMLAWAAWRGAIRPRAVLSAVGALAAATLASSMIVTGIWYLGREALPTHAREGFVAAPGPFILGFALIGLAVLVAVSSRVAARSRPAEAAAGALVLWTVLLATVTWIAPGASYLPLVSVVVGAAVVTALAGAAEGPVSPLRIGVATAACVLGMQIWAPLVRVLHIALSLTLAGALAPLTIAALGFVAPLAQALGWPPRRLALGCAAIGLVALVAGGAATYRDDGPPPGAVELVSVEEGGATTARIHAGGDPWTEWLVGLNPVAPPLGERLAGMRGQTLPTTSPPEGPLTEASPGPVEPEGRRLTLRAAGRGPTPWLAIELSPAAAITSLTVQGQVVAPEGAVYQEAPRDTIFLQYFAPPEQGIRLDLGLRGDTKVRVRVSELDPAPEGGSLPRVITRETTF